MRKGRSTEQEDVESLPRVCDEAKLAPDVDPPGVSPVERAILLGAHYGREQERDRVLRGLPPIKYRAKLPGPPPTCESAQAERMHAAQLGGRVVSRLLSGVKASPAAPAPAPKAHSGNPLTRWLRRVWRRLQGGDS